MKIKQVISKHTVKTKKNIMNYSAHIFKAGTIKVNTQQLMKDGFDITGALAAYEFKTLDALVEKAKRCDFVERPSGKIEEGENYTIRKAIFDFKN